MIAAITFSATELMLVSIGFVAGWMAQRYIASAIQRIKAKFGPRKTS